MAPRHVVITGLGAITPIGSGRDGLWEGVLKGKSGVRRVTRFDASRFTSQIAAEIDDFDPLNYMSAKKARRLDRFSQLSLAAAKQAIEDAGLDLEREAREQVAVYIGSALGGASFGEEQHEAYLEGGLRSVSPALALTVFGGASCCNIAMELGVNGPTISNANSCASGAIAIGEAFRLIRNGGASVVLAGGVEAPLSPLAFGAFTIIKALSTNNEKPARASRPFDRGRDGFVMGEGAAVLVLEELRHALARDAHIYAEVKGYGTSNDAFHMTAPLPNGEQAARAIRLAMWEAGIAPEEIDYVNAHGSSTPLNDKTETLALKTALGRHAYAVPISSTKGLYGHALGASGAIEAAICALVFEYDYLPKTVNLEEPDPECDLDYLPGQGLHRRVHCVLSNSFGFGGINAALILQRYPNRSILRVISGKVRGLRRPIVGWNRSQVGRATR